MELVWFKKDLRLLDHAALTAASQLGPVLALWIYEDEVIRAEDFDARHLGFANECLAELEADLFPYGVRLLRRRGDAVSVLEELWQQTHFTRLHSHQETGNAITYRRDEAVIAWARQRGVTWQEYAQTGVVRKLRQRDGWSERWLQRMSPAPRPAPTGLRGAPASHLSGESIGVAEDFFLSPDLSIDRRQRGGSSRGHLILDQFLQHRGVGYTKEMSSPVTAWNACSRVSPYLTWGALTVRQCLHASVARKRQLAEETSAGSVIDPRWASALKSFQSRLRWHCHFMQKLEDEPQIEKRNFSRVCDGLRDEQHCDPTLLEAWKQGRTGYPLIDACMRALTATGWLNFRMRAMVMSFASYHLWLHWREPGLHLARMFLDYEPGIHWSQCQMQSGTTGINTLRVYSPTKQLLDQDPDGQFIRQWLPELAQVPSAYLAEPWRMPFLEQQFSGCLIGRDYPFPIVDHPTAYRMAQEKMHHLRQRDDSKREARMIQKKHGSRKQGSKRWR
jgi:deoxyribodipyrimidine photo-lyase